MKFTLILNSLICGMATDPVTHATRALAKAGVENSATEQGTYFIARCLMRFSDWLIRLVGMEHNEKLFTWTYILMVFVFAMVIGLILKWIMVFILDKLSPYIKSRIYKNLVERRFFLKVCRIVPALLFMILIQFTLYMHLSIASWLTRISAVYPELFIDPQKKERPSCICARKALTLWC